MLKIVSIVGARPQFIKLAPLEKALSGRHKHILIHTGQHYDYDMSRAFFDQLDIPEPDRNLEIGSGSHAWQTGQMLSKVGEALEEIQPDLVLVYGDTNSTLAGALSAVKLHLPVAHVEAGYRSHDISMPEEVNRILTDRISQLLFAPTEDAIENLKNEGLDEERILFAGNIMAESLLTCREAIEESPVLNYLGLEHGGYILLTAHRPENTNNRERLENIFAGLARLPLPVVFPVHPRTEAFLESYGLRARMNDQDIRTIPPQKYLDFLKLESCAALIITDSGGVQEEAALLGVPCLTLRYNTERILTVKMGANRLVGADPDLIFSGALEALGAAAGGFDPPKHWDTEVASRIVSGIEEKQHLLSIEAETWGPSHLG